ncbi:PD-(D/E)XK nuclease family protein [Nitrosovibrio sp. Nv17]|uniref:PD-(D/E)XK nuclease family protein n=1 Tax=Nitrosovibrio sp. Nv17 TaxID=1855339 RepID=UPI0009091354|nr:PD-(D/E)XK nuclease family protein [Nitrosovibrio sp. Nv17]SFW25099.1 probable DNA repair protein [Nitrosovibrio sp. Nv17]
MVGVPHIPHTALDDILSGSGPDLPAGVTIVTPNLRLSATLKHMLDRRQADMGRVAWQSADILPFSALIERFYEDALYAGTEPELPVPLTDFQEQALWEAIVARSGRGSALMSIEAAAHLAREAWQLLHAWRLRPLLDDFPLDEDGAAFRDWARHYEQATRRAHQTDSARLCDLAGDLCGRAASGRPGRLILHGFDIVTPQQAALLARLRQAGCEVVQACMPPRPRSVGVRRIPCRDGRDESGCAAAWARARHEANPKARIAVVVPDLPAYRDGLVRAFDTMMAPDVRQRLPGTARAVRAFNISLGDALEAYPLVDTALSILELCAGNIDFERASLLLRSPFIGGADTEMAARARLDARLRRWAEPAVTLDRLLALTLRSGGRAHCPALVRGLSALARSHSRLSRSRSPAGLARRFSEFLRLAGFPGERTPDSREYQVLQKWHELLAEFAALGYVVPHMYPSDAVARLRRMAAATVFQPRTPDAPIQILGALEATGMEFDALWVMGLSADAWPPHSTPNPFLPAAMQRMAQLPLGSAAASLARARRLTNTWLSAAPEVVFSHPRRTGEGDVGELAPSPLIAHLAPEEAALPLYASHLARIQAAGRLERIGDDTAPPLTSTAHGGCIAVGGGAAVIREQAACPFRALARHRFGARSLEIPHAGLDARERGILMHHALAGVWQDLGARHALDGIAGAALDFLLARVAGAAIAHLRRDRPAALSGRAGEIEHRRLVRLVRAWLDVERARAAFTVVAVEDSRDIEIGGLRLSARLDRVDELDDGRRIVIDYKTRMSSVQVMLGERPDEPQLPLYLVAGEAAAVALAFAQVRPGDMRWIALARDADLLPGTGVWSGPRLDERHGSWETLVDAWRSDLARIAAGFRDGDARVDPKVPSHTCRTCDLQPLCRIDERLQRVLHPQYGET